MRTETIQVVKLEPSEGKHLKNKLTGEVYKSYIYLAKSLSVDDFEEITEEEYERIIKDREILEERVE